jgi:hypothetical protein
MNESRKKKLAGRIGVVCIPAIQVNGENAKSRNAVLLFIFNSVNPMRNIQKTFTNFIVIKLGQTFKKREIMNG